jgi:hypothetical protein
MFPLLLALQIHILNPFGPSTIHTVNPFNHPQGTVAPLLTASASDESCTLPAPLLSTGLEPKAFSDGTEKLNNDSGQTWNTQVPYAIGKCTTSDARRRWKFELHDTPNDHGQSDPSNKRRSEVRATASFERFHNNITYWHAFSFKEHWDCPACMKGNEVTIMQMHWPSGASPPFAFRAVGFNGGMGFRISTRGDSQNNITRYTGPLTGDVEHDVVYTFKLNGSSGDLTVWLDAKKVLDLHGVPIGSLTEDGYSFSFGPYGQLHGNLVTAEYGNIAPFPSTADLSSRISAPPVW